MTRKDYVLIANAINASRPKDDGTWQSEDMLFGATFAWKRTVEDMANALYCTNPRFDRERFVNACYGSN